MLINFVWNLLKLMPCSLKFVILLMKSLSSLSILLSSIPIVPCTAWGQSIVPSHRRNALWIICFAKFNDHTTHLFRKVKIIKFVDLVSIENYIFINKCFSCKFYSVFSHLYNLVTGRHNHQTRFAMNGLLILPNCNTAKFDKIAFFLFHNYFLEFFPSFVSEKNFRILFHISLKKLLKDDLISLYF